MQTTFVASNESNFGENSQVLNASKANKSSFEGTLFRNGQKWHIVRPAWLMKADETEETAERLYPGFVVARDNGKEESLFLSTLLKPVTTFEGDELVPDGSANQKVRAIFDAASTDDEALQKICQEIHDIVVTRTRKYNAYISWSGKSRPNSLLLEFDLA